MYSQKKKKWLQQVYRKKLQKYKPAQHPLLGLLDQKSPFFSPRILKFLLSKLFKHVLKCPEVKITVLCSFNREQEARIPFLRVYKFPLVEGC